MGPRCGSLERHRGDRPGTAGLQCYAGFFAASSSALIRSSCARSSRMRASVPAARRATRRREREARAAQPTVAASRRLASRLSFHSTGGEAGPAGSRAGTGSRTGWTLHLRADSAHGLIGGDVRTWKAARDSGRHADGAAVWVPVRSAGAGAGALRTATHHRGRASRGPVCGVQRPGRSASGAA